VIKSSKYLYSYKDVNSGCGPKQKLEKILSFQIPVEDPDLPKDSLDNKYNDYEKPLVRNMASSINGHHYQILYTIKIFVKHDSMTKFGEGECVTFPIKILEKVPQQLQ